MEKFNCSPTNPFLRGELLRWKLRTDNGKREKPEDKAFREKVEASFGRTIAELLAA